MEAEPKLELKHILPCKRRPKFKNDIYVLQGIDANEHTRIIAVFEIYDEAKKFCIRELKGQEKYLDLWIERHTVL